MKAVKILPVILTIILIIIISCFRKSISAVVSNPEALRNYILSGREYAVLIFIFLCSIRSLFLFPAGVYAVVAGMTFGIVPGMIYNCIGVTFSGIIAFFISNIAGKNLFSRITSKKLEKIQSKLNSQGVLYITELRMLPIFPFDAVSYASGLTEIKVRDFITGTFLGSLPGSFVYSYLGSNLYDVHSKKFLISLCMVVIISIIPILYKYVIKKG